MKQIAIDGPAGAGKSTIAKLVSKDLQFVYIDTGAMYRTIALGCMKRGLDLSDETGVCQACNSINLDIKYVDGIQHMFLENEDVSSEIRREEVGNAASAVSKYQPVRTRLVELQQELAEKYDVVMDGRDIGTVVLPKADLKVFLTASSEVRAERRYRELAAKGQESDIKLIKADIEARDYQDMHRENSPLKQADDAILLDTSYMSIEEVVEAIKKLYAL